jgi:hypothetical protein
MAGSQVLSKRLGLRRRCLPFGDAAHEVRLHPTAPHLLGRTVLEGAQAPAEWPGLDVGGRNLRAAIGPNGGMELANGLAM